MPHEVDFKITVDQGEESVAARFEDDEWERMQAYLRHAEELRSISLFQEPDPTKLQIHGKQGEPVRFEATLPEWDKVVVFLHKLRPLILSDEYAPFDRVRGFISRRIRNGGLRALLKRYNRQYDGRRLQDTIRIDVGLSIGPINLLSERTLKDWLNSKEYHRDPDLRSKIEEVNLTIPPDAFRVLMLLLLTEKARAIFGVAQVVEVILGKQREAVTLSQ